MAYEIKVVIVALFNYIKKMDCDEATKTELLTLLQQLANADSAVLALPSGGHKKPQVRECLT
ncbi:MAG: hypothetical protein LBK41_09215 [Clostridiales bacterium]|jgi:hypothetical protein|nr:hypothetical protein [Clostridiales bacterium]